MIFYKERHQEANIWDPSKETVIIRFTKQSRDKYGIDGTYETDDKKEIKLLKKMGYECNDSGPETMEPEQEA